ncbi:RHS repeat-associated core domain-containing protein [Streptomyces xiangluensis]|uniref:RHS repeat-associated core domain-containing protein n=1 Tax=Streptomyces xiangluensis TaxID=2665720 RepID=A0ABV8YI56_9ACTN
MLDLEKDPTPGDPDRVRSLARQLHDFADDVQDALRLVKGMAEEDAVLTMVGKTADVFRDEFSGVPKNLKKLKKSYDLAGDALAAYWPKLERAQALADKALVKGREAQADLASAKSRLSTADSWVTRATKEADKYKDDPGSAGKDVPKPDESKVRAATRDATNAKSAQTSAQSDVTSAQSALDAAKKMAADARQMREDAAREAKNKLEEASDAGIQNRAWYEEVGDWVSDNWDTIVTVCKVVVAVVGIIAMIIGGPILGAIVLIAALVVLADTLNKYRKGQASLWDVAFAALDCIPGMKGLTTLGGLAKGLKSAGTMGLKGMAKSLGGLAKNAKTAIADGAKGAYNRLSSKIKGCGDPVDPATGQMFLDDQDITLPGTLPLTFTRRSASGYRCGWWFGPSWSSTIDQRLEIDESNVVFVTEDGMLLAYPRPEGADLPVMPEAGPRWPLVRLDDNSYRISNPITGHSHQFAAPSEGLALLERITDRNGNTITFDYDENGTPLAIRHSGGYQLALAVNEGRVTTLSVTGAGEDNSDLAVRRYGYTDGNLTSVTNSSGLATEFTYDERLRITSWTDTNRCRYKYAYDAEDRCIAQGGEAGHMVNSFEYDVLDPAWPECRVTEITTAEEHTSRFVVNDNCQVIAEIDPLGGTVHTSYDAHHHLISSTDQLGYTTSAANNELGQPTEVTRPDGTVVHFTYSDLNLITAIDLPDGTTWRYAYDERGNCTAATDPVGRTAHSAYSAAGHATAVSDALGHTTEVRCNPAGLPMSVTDPTGAETAWQRDAFGRPVAVTDPLGHTTHFAWSPEGRLVGRTTPDGATEAWSYDGEGNCTSHTDQLGQVSRFEYTHFDLLAARSSPDGARSEFAYDASLRLTSVTNPQGLTWSYEFDSAGRLISETDFDNRTLIYTHDAVGRITSRTNAIGETITFERDAFGQIIRKNAAGSVTAFAYNLHGSLTRAAESDYELVLRYDDLGRLCSETANGRTVTYAYDAVGRRIRRITPSGATSTWIYDPAGNRTQLNASGRTVDFIRDSIGREIARSMGTNVTLAQAFDELGRLTDQSVTVAEAHPVQQRAYTYRADGNLVQLSDQQLGTRRFDLDPAGRITAVHAQNWTESYAYDAVGNQTQATWPHNHADHEATGPRAYTGTRITQAGRVRYEHDELGRITLRQKTRLSRKPDTWRYTWDAEDRLTSVVTPDGTLWRYTYDPLGRRTAKLRIAADGETVVERTEFSWDGTNLCEQTTTSEELANAVTLTWDHQGQRPIAQTERIAAGEAPQDEIDSRFFAIVTDLVGTPTELIDESGDIAWRTRTSLWGITSWASSSTAYTPLRFPGQYFDPETGLHYNFFRHYDPETARYVSLDPLGLTPGPNPLGYVNNPFVWIDPLGLSPCSPGTRDDALLALNRAEELQSLRNDYWMADVRGTTAVIGVFNSETRQFTRRIGINGDGPMPSGWQLGEGEEFVRAPGHAEEGILNSLGPNEHAVYGAASRNFCNDICLPQINVRGIEIGGQGVRGHMPQNSPYTLFWTRGD